MRPLRWLVTLCALGMFAAPAPARAQRIREIQVAPRYLRMRQDAQTRMTATAYDEDGMPVDIHVQWRSANINVAVVDSDGNVKAIAPGTTSIMALVENGRRRGQAVVVVMREGGPPGQIGPGGMPPGFPMNPPGMPFGPNPPGLPPGVPGRVQVQVDSAMRASFDCRDPMISIINPLRACWDQRPSPAYALTAAPPKECPERISRAEAMLLVSDSGAITERRWFRRSNCPAFMAIADSLTRGLQFAPAQRGGKPVSAWVRVSVGPAPL